MANSLSEYELERALLGLLIVNPKAINVTRGYLLATDFFDSRHRLLYQIFLELQDENYNLDLPTVISKLKAHNRYQEINESYLADLVNDAGFFNNINNYIKVIADKAQLRKVAQVIKNLGQEVHSKNTSPAAILEKVETDIMASARDLRFKDFESSQVVVDRALQSIEKQAVNEGISGIPSDFPSIDDLTSGFQKGDLFIIAARPSMGKTAFALNLAANVAKNYRVALFSLEMPAVQIMNRILSFKGYIEGSKLREPRRMDKNDWDKLHLVAEKIKHLKLYIDDSAGIKISEIAWKSKKLYKNQGLDMIIVDYLQLINVGTRASENRQVEVSLISRLLKKLARELEIPVIALSQLSRRVEQRENKTPMMSDLRESGAIEQDADLIAFLYREAYYDKDKGLDTTHQTTDVIIAKHRNGAVGTVKLSFNPKTGLFTDRGGKTF